MKKNIGILDSTFDKDYYKNLDVGNQRMNMAVFRAKSILFYWVFLYLYFITSILLKAVFLGVATNSFAIYPVSVKIVRKMFKLTGFWNIHFAIIPILLNWNAFTLGVGEGIYTYYTLKR